MPTWLAAMAVVFGTAATHAQTNAPGTPRPVVAASHMLNVSPPPDALYTSDGPLHDGLIAEDGLAPNANFDVGLAPMSDREARSLRLNEGPVTTRNPGVSFVLKF